LFALLRPAQLDGTAALIVAESFGTNGRFAPEAANRQPSALSELFKF
jgi:hypothetical protein